LAADYRIEIKKESINKIISVSGMSELKHSVLPKKFFGPNS
jgi:hypothetical protein